MRIVTARAQGSFSFPRPVNPNYLHKRQELGVLGLTCLVEWEQKPAHQSRKELTRNRFLLVYVINILTCSNYFRFICFYLIMPILEIDRKSLSVLFLQRIMVVNDIPG